MKTVYSRDFKVKMCEKVITDKQKHAEVAAENGINPIMLYRWISEYRERGERAFCGKGSLAYINAELHGNGCTGNRLGYAFILHSCLCILAKRSGKITVMYKKIIVIASMCRYLA